MINANFYNTSIITRFTFEQLLFLMDWSDMLIQILFYGKSLFASFTFEWLLSFMDWSDMYFHGPFFSTTIETEFTLEWFFAFMDWCNVHFHASFHWKTLMTFSFMAGRNMLFQGTFFSTTIVTQFTLKWIILHGLKQCADSCYFWFKSIYHKIHTWMASFSYVLKEYADSYLIL